MSANPPSVDDQRVFWNDWNLRNREIKPLDRASVRRRDEVLKLVHSLKLRDASILDVGCANGWLTTQLSMFGAATGTDISDESIRIAKERYSNASFVCGDFLQLDLGIGTYDLLVCVDSLASIADHASFLAHMRAHLKPGGHLILTSQNPTVFSRNSSLAPLAAGQIRNWASRARLRALLGRDFEVQSLKTVNPAGDRGFLHFVNSARLNSVLDALHLRGPADRLRESCGLGQTIIVLAKKKK